MCCKPRLLRLGVVPGFRKRPGKLVERSEGRDQIPQQIGQHVGRKRSTWLQEKIKVGAKLEDFCSKDGGFSQGFPKEIQEAPQGKTLNEPRSPATRSS